MPENQPETPAAVGRCLQLPQATPLPAHHVSKGCWGRKAEPWSCRCWGTRRPQHPHCGAAPPASRAARGSVGLSWSSDTPWAGWRFVSSNDRSQEMNFLLLSCCCSQPSLGAISSIETTLKYFTRGANSMSIARKQTGNPSMALALSQLINGRSALQEDASQLLFCFAGESVKSLFPKQPEARSKPI